MAALTNAERQRRYRERQSAGERPVRYRRPQDRRSRPQRWRDAVETLTTLQAEYQDWLDALPESMEDTPTAERLREICELDLAELAAIEPPRGYGRDD